MRSSALGRRTSAALGLVVLLATDLLAQPARATARDTARARGAFARATAALGRAAQERQRARNESAYDDTFRKYAKRYFGPTFDWREFKAQGMAESDLDPAARSRVGARGIMQLMPSTFADIRSQLRKAMRIDDPEWNIAAGIAHDHYLWGVWQKEVRDEGERLDFMFASYNAGEGTIGRAHAMAAARRLDHDRWASIEQIAPTVPRWRYRETLGYVRRIRANADSLKGRRP